MLGLSKLLYFSKIFFINLVVILIICEILFRYIYTPKSLSIRMEMNSLAQEKRSNTKLIFDREYLRFKPNSFRDISHQEYSVQTTHDKFGFRNPCINEIDKSTEELFVGDSFVYGIGLSDNFTYGCQLKKNGLDAYTIGIPMIHVFRYMEILKKNINIIKTKFPNLKNVNLVLFLGNDFETLIDYGSSDENNDNKNSKRPLFRNYLAKLNYHLVKNKYLNDIYSLNGIKLLLKPIVASADKGDYVKNHSGSTFYKKSTIKKVSQITKSFEKFQKDLSLLDLKLKSIYLIEDPASLDSVRLQGDMMVARFKNYKELDVDFKVKNILLSCNQLQIKCFDTTLFLKSENYYKHDNHLRNTGAQILTKFITNQQKNLN